jgi:hypothetical protein
VCSSAVFKINKIRPPTQNFFLQGDCIAAKLITQAKNWRQRGELDMAQQNEKQKKAEQHLTDELANQARQEPGSAEESESKEKRAQAEKELQDAT